MPRVPERQTPVPGGAPRPSRKCQCCQAVVRKHDQLPSLVAANVLSGEMALVQDANFITVGANADQETV